MSQTHVSPALRPPPGSPRFPLFDSQRGIGMLSVLIVHVTFLSLTSATWWGRYAMWLGLELGVFFVMSGFLLYRPFVAARIEGKPRPSLRAYGRHRVLRVLPGYWFALTVLAIFPGTPYLVGPFTHDWWAVYGFGQIYQRSTLNLGIGPAWSLCVEATFYALLPLYILVADRLAARVGNVWGELVPVGTLFGLSIGGNVLIGQHVLPVQFELSLISVGPMFGFGTLLAWASVSYERRRSGRRLDLLATASRYSWLVALGVLLLLATAFPFKVWTPGTPAATGSLRTLLQGGLMYAFCIAMVAPSVFGHEGGGLARRILRLRAFAWLGTISYGTYLWHLPILLWLTGIAPGRGIVTTDTPLLRVLPDGFVHGHAFVALFLVGVPLSVAAGAASYYLVELPFLRRKYRRFWPRRHRSKARRTVAEPL